MLITTMFIQLSEFNFAHGQPTCKALYRGGFTIGVGDRYTRSLVPKGWVCTIGGTRLGLLQGWVYYRAGFTTGVGFLQRWVATGQYPMLWGGMSQVLELYFPAGVQLVGSRCDHCLLPLCLWVLCPPTHPSHHGVGGGGHLSGFGGNKFRTTLVYDVRGEVNEGGGKREMGGGGGGGGDC